MSLRKGDVLVAGRGGSQIETIYDMNSSDSSINWGYTSGLSGTSGTAYTNSKINLTKYKSFKFTLNLYTSEIQNIGSSNLIVEQGTDYLLNGYSEIHGEIPYLASGTWQSSQFKFNIRIWQNNLYVRFYYGTTAQDGSAPYYAITKIEGVLR